MNIGVRFIRANTRYDDTPETRCLVASLHATEHDGGIGNVMFELLGFMAIAKQLNRINRLQLIKDFTFKLSQETGEKKMETTFKYLWDLSRPEIMHAVRGSSYAMFVAKHRLFPSRPANRTELKYHIFPICVHIRRGDFAESSMHLPSDKEFTIAAMQYLVEKVREEDTRAPHIYVFTDNIKWTTKEVVEPYLRLSKGAVQPQIATAHGEYPPNSEWEFSRTYCDRVLLTAATSTYGWWLAFLSRGERIYYNKKHVKPGVRSDEFSATDFWPQHWTPLYFTKARKIVEL
ncbi:unnamed protein product [Heligmosomoides polygyrus]|uniref:L-Fucosyltransferase n=1 Tax=Heligmosomoides polygyrus TaxID=6339 RepID=A0A3P7TBC1_HELPZ|nr:unnamed protein product [Heligmosomoides polygyrus]